VYDRPVADNNRDPHAIDLVEAPFDGFHPLETVVAMNKISDRGTGIESPS
jgi:hypothetical protein